MIFNHKDEKTRDLERNSLHDVPLHEKLCYRGGTCWKMRVMKHVPGKSVIDYEQRSFYSLGFHSHVISQSSNLDLLHRFPYLVAAVASSIKSCGVDQTDSSIPAVSYQQGLHSSKPLGTVTVSHLSAT